MGSKAMKTCHLLKRPITSNLKDPLSKAEEPEQPFRLASSIILNYDTVSKGEGQGEG